MQLLLHILPDGNALLTFVFLVGFILCFKSQIRSLMSKLTNVKYSGVEVSFKQEEAGYFKGSKRKGLKPSTGSDPYFKEIGNTNIPMTDIYLDHDCFPADRTNGYFINVYLNAETTEIIEQVKSVKYHLHPSFKERSHFVNAAGNINYPFALERILAFGEFCIMAEIEFKSGDAFSVYRYLSFAQRMERTPKI